MPSLRNSSFLRSLSEKFVGHKLLIDEATARTNVATNNYLLVDC